MASTFKLVPNKKKVHIKEKNQIHIKQQLTLLHAIG